MNIFEQYGIKEVADVTLYSIELDQNDDEIYVPVLYLDTLKVSSVEETAQQTSAKGGLGNPELIIWDYGKEITVTLEDATYSPASQGMMWGGKHGTKKFELYGDFYSLQIGANLSAKIIFNDFSDFKQTRNNAGHDVFIWTCSIQLITDNGAHRYMKENVQISYSLVNGVPYWSTDTPITIENKGHFTLINERNTHAAPPQEVMYQIDHALNNVDYLDRLEKCTASQTFVINTDINTLHGQYRFLEKYSQCALAVFIDPRTMQPYEPNTSSFVRKNGQTVTGQLRVIKQNEQYYKWTRSKALDYTSLGHQIIVDATHFPGTYRLVGETYSRSRNTGKDERFQFEIPLCKMGSENSFTFDAAGDPTTFTMTLKVLRKNNGQMMKLTQYSVEKAKYDGVTSDSTNVIPEDEVVPTVPDFGDD